MKQVKLLATCIFLLLVLGSAAQDISKLAVPASPAFSILDFEPTAIMRPTNAKALASDVLSSFDRNGKLLTNLGLEVAPYWLKSNPSLSREKYLHPDVKQAFLQSLSLSAATVKDSISNSNKLGAGFRFRLLNGRPVDELEDASNQLQTRTTVVAIINGVSSLAGTVIDTRQKALQSILDALRRKSIDSAIISSVQADAASIENDYTDSAPDIRRFLEQLISMRVSAYTDLAQQVSDLIYQRKGFMLEFAGASGFSTKDHQLDRFGIWGNATYCVSADDLLSLTARYMNKNHTDSTMNNFDMGVGYLKKTRNYNISVEALLRWYTAEAIDLLTRREEREFTYRFAVQGSYAIGQEVSITLSFGKDFNAPFISRSGYFSILGFNYSIFNKKPAELKE